MNFLNNVFIPFFLIVIYAFILAILANILIYHPVYLTLPLAIITPILISVLQYFKISPPYYNKVFTITKLYSLAIGLVIIPLLILGVFSEKYLPIIIIILLVGNVIEAVIVDFKAGIQKSRKHLLNAVSGIIVMLTFPFIANIYWVKPYFFYAGSPGIIYWIIAYTIWNWNFVLLNFPKERSLVSVSYLTAPLIYIAYINIAGYWLIARGVTLFIGQAIQGIVGSTTFYPYLQALPYFKFVNKWETKIGQLFIFSLIIILSLLFFIFR